MARFLLGLALIAAGVSLFVFFAAGRLERRRRRRACPSCRDGLAVVMVSQPELLCPDHLRRLHQIEQLEDEELS